MRGIKHLIFTTVGCIFISNMIHLPFNENISNTRQVGMFTEVSLTNETYRTNAIITYTTKSSPDKKLPLIIDCKTVDYMSYVPKMNYSSNIKSALDIENPKISLAASSAILFNANTGEVLFFKEPVIAVFPASTAKILSSLVALDWCNKDDKITVGNEIKMIASDSSKANLKQGQILTAVTVLKGMLLPSGNDAAYVMAIYVGRKSLKNTKAKNIDAITEFVRLMNLKAHDLGAVNSCFITPDGYDARGQYTTAYDMGMIGLAAIKNKTILSITNKSSTNDTLISGEKVSWNSTNSLIKKDSKWYYSNAIGLKTGTTEMAGRCLISGARKGDDLVVCVVMDSTSDGRWSDSLKLLKYGLNKLD